MTTKVRAHFDGRVIVPDEPVAWREGQEVSVVMESQDMSPSVDPERRRKALEEFFALALPGHYIPDEALRRENIYEDRG